jgi:hypothetical protein
MVTVMQPSAIKKTISATSSIFSLRDSLLDLRERNESIQLNIKNMEASPVLSSIIVASPKLEILIDVRIIRQNPSRLDDVLKI